MEHSGTRTGPHRLSDEDLAVAAQLRAERARADLTQIELARRAKIAINTLRRIENEERTMSLPQLFKLCRALGIEPGRFLDAAQAATRRQ